MLRLMQLGFAALALAMAATFLAAPSARAFTIETLGGGSSGGSRFADPDDQVKNFGPGVQPFGQGGPIVQFGAGGGPPPYRPFGPQRPFVPPQMLNGGNND